MAPVKSMNGTKLLIQISDGGDPAVFTHDCLINAERGIQFSSDRNDEVVPDCDNPDSPGWKSGTVDGLQATVNGAGMLHTTSIKPWFNWLASGETKVVRIKTDVSAANGGGYWEGPFNLTAFEITGSRGAKATSSETLVSNGALVWVDAT